MLGIFSNFTKKGDLIMNKFKLAIVLVIIVISSLLISCSQKAENNNKIKIGVILNLTGSISKADEPKKLVLESALKYLQDNSAPNDPVHKFDLIIQDGKSDAKEGISAFNKLYSEGVRIFITGGSLNGMSLLPLTEKNKCLLMAVSGHPDFTKDTKYAIRLYPRIQIGSKMMVDTLNKNGVRKIYVLHTNEPFGKSYADEIVKQFKGKIVGNEEFQVTQIDFKNIIAKLKGSGAERIVVIGYGIAEQNLISQMIENKIYIPVMGSEVFYYASNNLKNNYTSINNTPLITKTQFLAPLYVKNLLSLSGDTFTNYYRKEHNNNDPQMFGIFGADALPLLQKCFTDNDSIVDIDKIHSKLTALEEINSFSGNVSVMENGDINYPLILMKFDDKGNIVESK